MDLYVYVSGSECLGLNSNGMKAKVFLSKDKAIAHAKSSFINEVQSIFGPNHMILFVIEKDGTTYGEFENQNGHYFYADDEWEIYNDENRKFGAIIRADDFDVNSPDNFIPLENSREEQCLLEDAQSVFCEYVRWYPYIDDMEDDPYDDKECNQEAAEAFQEKYGFPVQDALDKGSEYYILDEIIAKFRKYQNWQDADYDTWMFAVESVLDDEIVTNKK